MKTLCRRRCKGESALRLGDFNERQGSWSWNEEKRSGIERTERYTKAVRRR